MDRDSESEARAIIERVIPKAEPRRLCLFAFAESIREANKYGHNKWGITLLKDRVRLNVGGVVVCTLCEGGIWLALGRRDMQNLRDLVGFTVLDRETYQVISSIDGQYTPSQEHHSEVWPKIREPHFELIKLAAEKYRKLRKPSKESHSPGVLKYIRRELVPEPNY